MAEVERSRLGRGLAALIGDVGEESAVIERARGQRRVPIEHVKPNPRNPRRIFADEELDALAQSIRERGIVQPILARTARGTTDHYEIVAGERRWRAAQRAGLHDVPIVLVEVGDREALEIAVIENVQRADLNPLEEAGGYQALIDDFHHSHDDVAKIVGRSRVHITNTLRLLKLPDPVKALIDAGKLAAGHARALVGQPNALALAQQVVARDLSVRQVEELARRDGKRARTARRSGGADPNAQEMERRLTDALGLPVQIRHRADGAGVVSVHYRNLEQLDEIARRLGGGKASIT